MSIPDGPVVRPAWPAPPQAPGAASRLERAGRLLYGVAAVLVLGAGGVASAVLLLEDDRGAASPEAAGEDLLEAVNRADVIGVIELLPEGERDLLLDIAGEVTAEGERLGLLDEGFGLDGFPGVDVRVADPVLEVQRLGEGLATVTVVDGIASFALDGDALTGALGDAVDAVLDANGAELEADDERAELDIGELHDELEQTAEDLGHPVAHPFRVVVVSDGGRWYPSLAYTLVDSIRYDGGGPPAAVPDLDDGVEADGASDPLDAVQELVDAAAAADAESALEVLDPGELAALQRYAETLFGELATGEDTGVSVEITDAEVRSLGDGVHRVVPTGLVAEADFGGEVLRLTIDGDCIALFGDPDDETLEDLDVELCADDLTAGPALEDELAEELGEVEVPQALTDLVDAFTPVEVGIITVERDGEHYVSPIRTLVDLQLGFVRGLERADLAEGGIVFEALTGGLDEELEAFFEEVEAGFDEQFEEFEDEFPRPGDDESDDEASDVPLRTPTGPSGPGGELLVGDVVEGQLAPDGVVTFTVVGVAGEGYVGAQTAAGADLTITVRDATTGEELDFSDDFVGTDPEAFVILTEGQRLTVDVAGFGATDAGRFVVYYER